MQQMEGGRGWGVRERRMLGAGEARETGNESIKKEIAQRRENEVRKHS